MNNISFLLHKQKKAGMEGRMVQKTVRLYLLSFFLDICQYLSNDMSLSIFF